MTLADWLRETEQRYRELPARTATKRSAIAFWQGANRRVLDPHIGRVWWKRDDWDILVIMDACRVDLARQTLDEPVRSVWSPASTSIDWIERHFADKHREDWNSAGYVTGNPFADNNAEDARSADLRDKDLGYFEAVYEDRWQKQPIGTTPPGAITDAAIRAWAEEDIDRLIVHYMQPHQPFRTRPDWESVYSNLENLADEVNQGGPDVWKRVRSGELDFDEAWAAYRDNLWWVWANIHTELISNVDGRVLISSDHGNGLGEWGSWGHRGGDLNPHVRRVPVLGPYTRGLDVRDTNADVAYLDDEVNVSDQLESLGYR